MRIRELIELLQEEEARQGDAEVIISVDISTGEHDLDRRAFGRPLEPMWNNGSLVLLCEGETND